MAKGNVTIEMTSDDAKLFRALRKQEAALKRLEGGVGKVGKASKRAGHANKKAFDVVGLKNFTMALTGGSGLLMGLQMVTEELEKTKNLWPRP